MLSQTAIEVMTIQFIYYITGVHLPVRDQSALQIRARPRSGVPNDIWMPTRTNHGSRDSFNQSSDRNVKHLSRCPQIKNINAIPINKEYMNENNKRRTMVNTRNCYCVIQQ